MADDGKRKYLVASAKGDFVLELPAEYKLTFSAVNPGAQMSGRDLHCLRVYDGPNTRTAHLRAVFCDVRSFRDLSFPLARKVSRETGSAEWTMDSEGNFDRKEQRRLLDAEWQGDEDESFAFNGDG